MLPSIVNNINAKEKILDLENYESFNVARDINYSIGEIFSSIKSIT